MVSTDEWERRGWPTGPGPGELTEIRGWYRYLVRADYLTATPAETIHPPKVHRRTPTRLSRGWEVQSIHPEGPRLRDRFAVRMVDLSEGRSLFGETPGSPLREKTTTPGPIPQAPLREALPGSTRLFNRPECSF